MKIVARAVACDECTRLCKKHNHYRNEPSPSPVLSRFFKVMFGDDFEKLLYIPPDFAQKVQHLVDQEVEIEDSSGQRWPVTMSIVNDSLAMERGWQKFYQDHRLRQGDFLVFNYKMGNHFVVQIYGKNACERINLKNEMPRHNKRARRDKGTSSEDEPIQTPGVNFGDKPTSAVSVLVASEFQSHHTNPTVTNAIPMDMDDLAFMIKRDYRNCQEEDRDILYDLSSFEVQNRRPAPNKFQKTELGKAFEICNIEVAEQNKRSGDDAQMRVVQPLDTKPVPSHTAVTNNAKTTEDEAEMAVIPTYQEKGHSGYNDSDKFERALGKKPVPRSEIAKKIIKKADDTQRAVAHPSQIYAQAGDILTDKLYRKPFTNNNFSKEMYGSSKIVEGAHVDKSGHRESSFRKDPIGRCAVKREPVEMEDESCGKEPAVLRNTDQMSPAVKLESDVGPSISPFSAVVKSKLYLDLPPEFPPLRGRREKGRGKVVYLKDMSGRIWPLLYPDKFGVKALTVNWSRFCDGNDVMVGDECRFLQDENYVQCVLFRVYVCKAGESPHN